MEHILNLIRSYSRCCLNCGSLKANPGSLCVYCETVLTRWEFNNESTKPLPGLNVQSLYRWQPGRSDALSRLILWLKGTQQQESWQYYAQKLVQQNSHKLQGGKKIYVIPAPANHEGKKDHAYLWGQSLATALGAELVPCLRKVTGASQRGSDRGTRALIEMEVLEKYTEAVALKSQALWIFADDILTTGATARSAHIALGSPADFEIWVLAQRGLSCGASRDLL